MTADPHAPPFIDPRIADPMALKYAQGAELRRRSVVPKYTEPVAGGPDVRIPRLDGDHVSGRTMLEHAHAERGLPAPGSTQLDVAKFMAAAGEPAMGGAGGIIAGNSHQVSAEVQPKNAQGASVSGILMDDVLPPVAQQDPAFSAGGGAMFAINQPHLARKYGVIRGGKHVPAQMLGDAGPAAQQPRVRTTGGNKAPPAASVSSQTLEGLQAISEFNSARNRTENDQSDTRIENDALKGPAGGAGTTERPLSEAEKKAILDDLDDYDVSRFRNAMFKDLLNNDEQRAIIEKRLKPLSLAELINNGVVMQKVPVHPGVFEPVFQSYGGDEDIQVKRLLSEETRSNSVTDQYALDKYSLMGLTVSLYAVNGNILPNFKDEKGDFDNDAFWKKYKIVSKYNTHMLASLVANWFWFDVRVRKLWKAEDLGNG